MTILLLAFATFVKEAGVEDVEVIQKGEIGIATSTVKETEEILAPIKKAEASSFEWPGELRRICSCESNGHPDGEPTHYEKDGSVKIGKINPLDTGMCQINLHYHGAKAEQLGIDLHSPAGNFEYASMLYREEGSTPWNWSASCWKK